jgi:hypothetical protein
MGHAENIIGLIHQFGSEHAAAQMGNIDAQFLEARTAWGLGGWPSIAPTPAERHGNPPVHAWRGGKALRPSGCDKYSRCKQTKRFSFLRQSLYEV